MIMESNKFSALKALGAGDFQHLNGSLEQHLTGTQAILKKWNSSTLLQTAGLFHAAYGTAAFTDNMVAVDQRQEIANVIGVDEEALVYLYCSCDRDFVFPQFNQHKPIVFKDRFNNDEFELSKTNTELFCELTVANELELVYESNDFKMKHGKALLTLFTSMDRYLSTEAKNAYKQALSDLS